MKTKFKSGFWYKVDTTHGTEFVFYDLVDKDAVPDSFDDYIIGRYIGHKVRHGVGVKIIYSKDRRDEWVLFPSHDKARMYVENIRDMESEKRKKKKKEKKY